MSERQIFRVHTPVADLRRGPKEPERITYARDFDQETQLLYGECVLVKQTQGEWLFVEALEQPYNSPSGWTGYPGWIKKAFTSKIQGQPRPKGYIKKSWADIYQAVDKSSPVILSLSFGTRLEIIEHSGEWCWIDLHDKGQGAIRGEDIEFVREGFSPISRQRIAANGELFLGQPYLWGGRSAHDPAMAEKLTGCDCSGLVNLLYRTQGIDLPRNAKDQFLKCVKREPKDLEVADLIFLSDVNAPEKIGHVMLYCGGDMLVDANITDGKTVKTSFSTRFGCPFSSMHWGQTLQWKQNSKQYCVYFGSPMA